MQSFNWFLKQKLQSRQIQLLDMAGTDTEITRLACFTITVHISVL